jgi:hypothetical protein
MTAEGAGAMMILAVHVVGDGAAERDEARSGRHRQKPAARNRQGQDLVEQDAGFAAQQPRLLIEGDEAIERTRIDQPTAGVQTDIAITAPVAEGQYGDCGILG